MPGPVIARSDPRLAQGVPPWVQALMAMSDLSGVAGVMSFPRLAVPLSAKAQGSTVAKVAAEVRKLSRELGHPFGDRDEWSAYLEMPSRDQDLSTLREMLGDLRAIARRPTNASSK